MAYFLYNWPTDNVAGDASVSVQTGTEDPQYLALYISDFSNRYMGKFAQLQETSGAWVFDFGAAQRVDLIAFAHSFDAGTVYFQGNASNTWGSPTLNVPIVIPERREDDYTVCAFADLREAAGYDVAGLRYYRLYVPTAQTNPLAVKVWLGATIRQLARPLESGLHQPEGHVYIEHRTPFLYSWIYDLLVAPRLLTGKITHTTASLDEMFAWFRACRGRVLPTLVIPDPDIMDARFVRFQKSPSTSGTTSSGSGGPEMAILDPELKSPHERVITAGFEEVVFGPPR